MAPLPSTSDASFIRASALSTRDARRWSASTATWSSKHSDMVTGDSGSSLPPPVAVAPLPPTDGGDQRLRPPHSRCCGDVARARERRQIAWAEQRRMTCLPQGTTSSPCAVPVLFVLIVIFSFFLNFTMLPLSLFLTGFWGENYS
jgi:hypothetical protein